MLDCLLLSLYYNILINAPMGEYREASPRHPDPRPCQIPVTVFVVAFVVAAAIIIIIIIVLPLLAKQIKF